MADKSWDDQYISKTDAIKLAIISIVPFANADNINGIQNSFEKTIGDFPSADVQPVVRCKDCKNLSFADRFCYKNSIFVCSMDWFCAGGERRDGGT